MLNKNGNKRIQTGIEPNPFKVYELPKKPMPDAVYYVINQNKTVSIYVTDMSGVPFPVGVPIIIPSNYITNVVSPNGTIDVDMLGNIARIDIAQSILDKINSLTVDYVSNVSLDGTNLVFTGVNSAFNGLVDLSSLADDTDNYATAISFNPTSGVLTVDRTGILPSLTTNLDGRYLTSIPSTYLQTGDNVSELVNDAGYITSETDPTVPTHVKGITLSDIDNWNNDGYVTDVQLVGTSLQFLGQFGAFNGNIDLSSLQDDTNTFLQGLSFSTTTGVLTATLTDSSTVTESLDGRYLQTETDPVFTASPSFGITSADISNWNNASAESHVQNTDQYLDFGGINQISALDINNHIQDTSIHFTQGEIVITESQISDLQHYVHPTYTPISDTFTGAEVVSTFSSDGIGSVTGLTTRLLTLADLGYTGDHSATNQTLSWDPITGNLTISDGNSQNLDGRYSLLGHTHVTADITDLSSYSGFVNYYTKVNLQTLGQASVHWDNITNTPTTLGGYGITDAYTQTQIDNLLSGYLKTETHVDSVAFDILTGVLTLGRNNMIDLTVDLDDRYSLLGHTHTTSDIINLASYAGFTNYYTKSEVDSRDAYISNVALTGTSLDFTGTNSAFSGSIDLGSLLDDTNTFVTNVNFDTVTGNLTLGFNNNPDIVESLDGRYLQSFTETDPLYTADKPNIVFAGEGNAQLTNDAGYITSFTDTTYTAGSGLNLTGTVFSINPNYTGFTNYYTETQIDGLLGDYYTKPESDTRYATIVKSNLPFSETFGAGDDLNTKRFSGILEYTVDVLNRPTSAGGALFSSARGAQSGFQMAGSVTANDEMFFRALTSSTFEPWYQVASREWVNAQGFLTSETDSQTLTFSTVNGDLTISNGNTVSIDGRYSLLGHTHTTSDITNLASYSGFANYYTKTNLQTSGQSQVHWDNLTNTPTTFPASPHTHPISDIIGLQTDLDSKMDRSNTITSGFGIIASPDFTTPISIEVNTAVLDTRYLRKDIDDNNGLNTLTLGEMVATNATVNTNLVLPSLAVSTSNTFLTYNTTTGVVEKKMFDASALFWGVANAAGTNQFDVPLESDLRFEGAGDTSISFNAATNTVTVTSIPGSGTGGAVTSFNGRTGGVVSVAGDYSTAQVTETTNLYFTEQRVRDTVLTGLSTGSSADIVATDSVIQAFGKIQGQLNQTASGDNTVTLNGTAGNVIVGGGATQDLSSNPSWTVDLVPSGVTMGTYTKVTVDAFGRVTAGDSLIASDIPNLPASKITSGVFNTARLGTGTANSAYYLAGDSTWKQLTSINLDWGNITNTPTTLSGYGITDAYTSSQVDSLLNNYYTQTESDGRYATINKNNLPTSNVLSTGESVNTLFSGILEFDTNTADKSVPNGGALFSSSRGSTGFHIEGSVTEPDSVWFNFYNSSQGGWQTPYRIASREWVNAQGFITTESDSQTLSFASATGLLSISGGNSVNLDGRYSLLGHTHTLSEITDLNSTDDLPEGVSNLYFTNGRVTGIVNKAYVEGLGISYNSLTGLPTLYTTADFNIDFGTKTTTDLTEGTNLYFTTTRARQSIDVAGDLSYNPITGIISFDETYSTPAQLLTALLTVDGTGSGLDADLLDGQNGSYYLDYNNFINTPTLTNDIDYIDSIALVGTSLNITSVGNAFSGAVDLSSLLDDTNNYVDNTLFSTATGVLTLEFNGTLPNITQDLNGRWSLIGHTHTTSEITDLAGYAGFTNYYTESQVDTLLTGYVPTTRIITAGNGMTGGGSLSVNRTITLGTPSSVTLGSINSVTATTHTHAFLPGGTASQYIDGTGSLQTFPNVPQGTVTSIATNNGITGGTITTSGTIGLTGQALELHNLATNGLIVRNGSGTVVSRSVAAGTGISVSNGNGVSGNPTVNLNHLGIQDLVDPNADRILFWDDSAGTSEWLTLGNNISITGTTLNAVNTNTTYSAGAGLTLTGTTFAINPTYTGFTNYYTETQIDNLLDGYSPINHNHTLDSLSNVTITSNTNGEILKWNGTAWVNNTLAQAGISSSNHTHATLSNGAGLTGANYNGGSATTWAIDADYTGFNNYLTETQSDGKYVNVTGDTMTGALNAKGINTVGNVLNDHYSAKVTDAETYWFTVYDGGDNVISQIIATELNGTGGGYSSLRGAWRIDDEVIASQNWVSTNFDNYQSWNLKTNGVQRTTIQSGGTLDLIAGTNTSLQYGAGGQVTINSSFNDTTYTAGTGLDLTGTEFSFDTAWGNNQYLPFDASATNSITNVAIDADLLKNTFTYLNATSPNTPNTSNGYYVLSGGKIDISPDKYKAQLFLGTNDDAMYYRSDNGGTGTYGTMYHMASRQWVNAQGFLTTETDPIFTASPAFGISNTDITNWNEKGVQLTADQPTANIHLRDSAGNIISTLNVGFLNNEGTTIFFNSATDEIELKDDAGNVLSSFPASALMTGVGFGLNLTGSTLELLDSANNIIDSVTLTIANVQGLQAELNLKADKTTTITGTGDITGGGDLSANRTLDLTAATKTKIDHGETAYGWGNHASANYYVNAGTLTGADDLNSISDKFYGWTTSPTNGPFDFGNVLQLSSSFQKVQLAFGNSGAGRLAVRRADSGTFYPWTEFASQDWVTSQNYLTQVNWGDITGSLTNQTDLQNALNSKFDDPTGTTSQYIDGTGSLQTFPTLPTVNNGTLTLTTGTGLTGGLTTFEANQSTNSQFTVNLSAATQTSLSNADTAFGWGDWQAGVDKSFVDALNIDADTLDNQNGSYYLDWDNFTGLPTTLAGYGITDALPLNASTVNSINNNIGSDANLLYNTFTYLNASSLNVPNEPNGFYVLSGGKIDVSPNSYKAQLFLGTNDDAMYYRSDNGGTGTYGTMYHMASREWVTSQNYITASSLPTVNNNTITINPTGALTGGGNFNLNQGSNESIDIGLNTSLLPTPTLQEVLVAGSTLSSSHKIDIGSQSFEIEGIFDNVTRELNIGNTIGYFSYTDSTDSSQSKISLNANGYTDISQYKGSGVRIFSGSNTIVYGAVLDTDSLSAEHTYTFPDASGTIALLSDTIPTDSGWQTVTPNSSVIPASDIRVKKIGNKLIIKGGGVFTTTAPPAQGEIILTLPVGYRPDRDRDVIIIEQDDAPIVTSVLTAIVKTNGEIVLQQNTTKEGVFIDIELTQNIGAF